MVATVSSMSNHSDFLRRILILLSVKMTDLTRDKILSAIQTVVENEYMKDEIFIDDPDESDKENVKQLPDRLGKFHKPFIEDVHCIDLYVLFFKYLC